MASPRMARPRVASPRAPAASGMCSIWCAYRAASV